MQTTKLYELKKIQTDFPKIKIKSSKDSADFIRQFYGDDIEIYESFFLLLLNRANDTIGYAKISQGGIYGTVVDVKIIAKYAVDSLASAVILAHNHPSGTLSPSAQDIEITKKIKQALSLLEINVLDHIILTSDNYYSFLDEGMM
jgi:DNA repair protein RadC